MKKLLVILFVVLLLTGCGEQETFETVEDMIPVQPVASPQQFFVSLPDGAAAPTFQDETGGELYVCQGYTISKQILESGDLEKTVQTLSGCPKEELQILKTVWGEYDRYDFVWTAAGEDGLQLGRACILDDGNYHYTLSTLTEEACAGELRQTLSDMYESCTLLDPEVNLRTGS